jgi:hypothetical protein
MAFGRRNGFSPGRFADLGLEIRFVGGRHSADRISF